MCYARKIQDNGDKQFKIKVNTYFLVNSDFATFKSYQTFVSYLHNN